MGRFFGCSGRGEGKGEGGRGKGAVFSNGMKNVKRRRWVVFLDVREGGRGWGKRFGSVD